MVQGYEFHLRYIGALLLSRCELETIVHSFTEFTSDCQMLHWYKVCIKLGRGILRWIWLIPLGTFPWCIDLHIFYMSPMKYLDGAFYLSWYVDMNTNLSVMCCRFDLFHWRTLEVPKSWLFIPVLVSPWFFMDVMLLSRDEVVGCIV